VSGLLSESDEERDRRELVELIERKGGRMAPRELVQASRKYRPNDVAEEALNELAESGWGVWETVGTGGVPNASLCCLRRQRLRKPPEPRKKRPSVDVDSVDASNLEDVTYEVDSMPRSLSALA